MAKPVYGKKAELPEWAAAVPKSAHKYFWDMIYSCPKPPKAKSDKFYQSLAWFFMHLLDKSRVNQRRNVYDETIVTYTYMRRHEKMQYAMSRHKESCVQNWLNRKVDRTRYDYIKGIARKYRINPSITDVFAELLRIDEPMYNLMKPLRRRPIFKDEKDLIESSLRTEIRPRPFKRPYNFNYRRERSSGLIELVKKAQANQRPYRFYLDRFLDIMHNARRHNRRKKLHMRLNIFLKRICGFGFRIVNDDPNDRLIEFYDQYSMNPVGSRLFGTTAAMPKLVKLLCFDHSYGRNFDMPNAQMVLLLNLMDQYGLSCPDLENLNHDKVAGALRITRGTAKTLNYGGIYSGWSNRKYFKQTYDNEPADGEQRKAMPTDLYRQLLNDTKVKKYISANKLSIKDGENYVGYIWDKWKEMFKPASAVVAELCRRISESAYTRCGSYHFKNESECSHEVPVARYGREQYTVLSHLIQGMENYNLLKILAEVEWCSAEFDGAILLSEYKGDVPLKEKPFMEPTLNSLLFMRLWENGHKMGKVRRDLFAKGSNTDVETVNKEYLKIVGRNQRESDDKEESEYHAEESGQAICVSQ